MVVSGVVVVAKWMWLSVSVVPATPLPFNASFTLLSLEGALRGEEDGSGGGEVVVVVAASIVLSTPQWWQAI